MVIRGAFMHPVPIKSITNIQNVTTKFVGFASQGTRFWPG